MNDFPPSDDAEEQFRALDDAVATELDVLSEQLFAATQSMQSVVTMSEPARADAISIARDILRLLKVTFGEVMVLSGLNLKSREEGLALGGLTAVGEIYSQLLAWARGIDGSIMSDPSVLAAIDAFGVIGYMAKREALRIARNSKDMFLATSLAQQLDTTGGKYLNPQEGNVGKLLERIENGIERVLSRVQDLTKSGVGVSQSKNDLGGTNQQTPIAGQAMQQNSNAINSRDAGTTRNAEALAAQQLAAQAEAARLAARAKREGRQPAPARPTLGATRQASQQQRPLQPQRTQPPPSKVATATAAANTTAAQMQNRVNSARMANIHNQHAHEEDEHHTQDQQALQRQLATARDAARRAAQKATAAAAAAQKQQTKPTISADMLKGFKGFDTSGMKPLPDPVKPQLSSQTVNPSSGLKPPPTPPVAPAIDPITNQPIGGKGASR